MVKIDLPDFPVRQVAEVEIIVIVGNDYGFGITEFPADGFGNSGFTGAGASSDQNQMCSCAIGLRMEILPEIRYEFGDRYGSFNSGANLQFVAVQSSFHSIKELKNLIGSGNVKHHFGFILQADQAYISTRLGGCFQAGYDHAQSCAVNEFATLHIEDDKR
jgi:hypothetical protein